MFFKWLRKRKPVGEVRKLVRAVHLELKKQITECQAKNVRVFLSFVATVRTSEITDVRTSATFCLFLV